MEKNISEKLHWYQHHIVEKVTRDLFNKVKGIEVQLGYSVLIYCAEGTKWVRNTSLNRDRGILNSTANLLLFIIES